MEMDFRTSRFETFAEAKFEVEKFCRENFHPITIAQKTTFASYNKKKLNARTKCSDFPDNECHSQKWICKHARPPKKRNTEGKRKTTCYFTNCKMKLTLGYNKYIKSYRFIKFCLEHNHEHGAEVYNKYPDQRIPKGDLKEQVQNLLKLGTKPSKVLDQLHSQGLKTTSHDIQNLKQMYKRQDTDTSMVKISQLSDGNNVLKEKKDNVNEKMTETETSEKPPKKRRKSIPKKKLSSNKLPPNDNVEGYINDKGEIVNEDGFEDWEKVRGINTWIGNKKMIENKIDTKVMSVINIKKREPTNSEDYSNRQISDSIINNLFENRKKLFSMEKLQTETHKEYRTRFEELYEKSKIEEMSMEQLKCFHFTKAYKESEEEDYLRKMTEKMSLNEKTTLQELVQICEEVDQLKTNLMMFNDSLELPSDVRFSEHNHSGQQIRECDCFTCGLTIHWKKGCPKLKNISSNLEISQARLLESLKRETVVLDKSVSDEGQENNVNSIKDSSCLGYDTTNVRLDQENVTKLNSINMFSSTSNNIPSSTSSAVVSSFNSHHLASSTPVVSSNPHVIKIVQLYTSPSLKPKNIFGPSVSLGNVKGKNSIKSRLSKNNKGLKNNALIGNRSDSMSGVTSTCVDTSTSLTFGAVKSNVTKNRKRK